MLPMTPEETTYDQASTTRFVGFSSDASNRNCLKSEALFSLKYVERPWTPIAKRRNDESVIPCPNAEFHCIVRAMVECEARRENIIKICNS